MEEKKVKRSKFSSNLGMMLACIGGAVGLGNVWGFPSKLGRGGGFYFLIIYVVVALLLGIPMTLSEYAIGRKMRKGPIAAWTELNRKWKFVGILNAIVCVGVMGFYCLLFGWIIKYMVEFGIAIFNPAGTFWTMDSAEYFSMFISNPVEPLIWTFVGLLLAYLCVRKNMARRYREGLQVDDPRAGRSADRCGHPRLYPARRRGGHRVPVPAQH